MLTKHIKKAATDCVVHSVPVMPTIIHIPHASRYIPDDVREFICLDEKSLEAELDRLTDHYTDELFAIEDNS